MDVKTGFHQRDIETMDRDRLESLQLERLQNTITRIRENVEPLRQRLDGIPDPENLDDLTNFPFLHKSDLRDNYPFGLFTVEKQDLTRIHASSGTTGKPTVVGYTQNDLDVWATVIARCLRGAGIEEGWLLHNAYGYGLFTGGLGLHAGAEKAGINVVPVSGGNTARQITLISDFEPDAIACTPSYALTLAEKIGPNTSLKVGILGAEPWTDETREAIEEGLGIVAVNIYGLSEVIGPGVSCETVARDGAVIMEDHFLPEVVDPESGEPLPDGEVGVLVLTSLTKEAFPVLRYWTGDLCSITREPDRDGRTHARMSRIVGRSDDMLVIRGVNVYPSQVEHTLLTTEGVSPHFLLIVDREGTLDTLHIRCESDVSADSYSDLKKRVRANMADSLGLTVSVSVESPGSLPRSEGGKLSRTVDNRS